ncbi:MAG: gamma-glutamyl-gamma-aminobutyrate hydrolase family protein [Gammaproteobacteria bacterium]|nr:gamma-glutamyl-gamma-aminobutyrate hydrolase family protein [Gammaproteobacteria bacterium]
MSKSDKHSIFTPVVGVPTCRQVIGDLEYDCTQHKYIAALCQSAGVLPLQIPLIGNRFSVESILQRLDGILLTGSHSNVHPSHYDDNFENPDFKLDQERDDTVLPLIKPAIAEGLPLFAICRGFQELNVAYGGELHSKLHEQASYVEHREKKDSELDERYAAVHKINLIKGGVLHLMLQSDCIEVNSLHEQGIRHTGGGLTVEGRAEDGLVEAVSVMGSRSFAIGVQWHPEWKSTQNRVSTVLFSEFGQACQRYMTEHRS